MAENAGRELSDLEFMQELISLFGVPRAGRLALFCLYWAATGSRNFGDVQWREEGLRSERTTRWRAYQDLKRLRDRVVELEGRPADEVEVALRVAGRGPLLRLVGTTGG